MKAVSVLALLVASSQAYVEYEGPNGEKRLCPNGYFYAGEDTPRLTKDVWLEEASRSPTYSCYKVFDEEQMTYFKAGKVCEEDKGHLISLEDAKEIQRVNENAISKNDQGLLLTSAIYTYFEGQWNWMGSNQTFDSNLIEDFDSDFMNGSCLALKRNQSLLEVVSCTDKMSFACEQRVQTVSYYAWFVANWFSLLLVFLVVVLLISLCITTSMYRQKQRSIPGRIYRSQATTPVFEDKPPSYNRATGQPNGYLARGREFLAKVTINPRSSEQKA